MELAGNSGVQLVQPLLGQGKLRTVSCWVLTTFKDGASTTCLGNLFPFLVSLPVKNKRGCFWVWVLGLFFPLCLNRISCISTCARCLLSFHWAPLRRSLHLLYSITLIRPPPP